MQTSVTRAQCETLETSGAWAQERLELVDGQLFSKLGKNRAQVQAATLILKHLIAIFGADFINAEAPIDVAPGDLAMNEPVPDVIVLRRASESFDSNPAPGDLNLVVEIADSSVRFDLTVKAALYARAAISEYWVLDVAARRLVVHREPQSGAYRNVASFVDGELVSPIAASDRNIAISEILPKFQ